MTAATQLDWRTRLVRSAPTFLVVRSIVHFDLGGFSGRLGVGQSQQWNKHGLFRVEYAEDSYAIIHHETVSGWVKKIFIPPKMRAWISNGRWTFGEVNYQSFLDVPLTKAQRLRARLGSLDPSSEEFRVEVLDAQCWLDSVERGLSSVTREQVERRRDHWSQLQMDWEEVSEVLREFAPSLV